MSLRFKKLLLFQLFAVLLAIIIPSLRPLSEPNVKSPVYGIQVELKGFNPNLNYLDMKYKDVMGCMGITSHSLLLEQAKSFFIIIQTDEDYFECPIIFADGIGLNDYCFGYFWPPDHIYLTEDLFSLGHELTHKVRGLQHDDITYQCGSSKDDKYSYLGYSSPRTKRMRKINNNQ